MQNLSTDTNVDSRSERIRKIVFAGVAGLIVGTVVLAVALDFGDEPAVEDAQPTLPQKLLTLSDDSAQRGGASENSDGIIAESGAAADMLWWDPVNYIYLAGESLSDEAGVADGYRIQLNQEAGSFMNNLAKLWNVDPATVKQNPYSFDSNFFAAGDWEYRTGSSITYYHTGAGNWGYSNSTIYMDTRVAVECVVLESMGDSADTASDTPVMRDKDCLTLPSQPVAPKNVITEAEALRVANELFAKLYDSVPELKATSYEWGVDVNGSILLDGKHEAGLAIGISWYGDQVSYAYGVNAYGEKVSNIAIVSAREAASRASDYRWWGFDSTAAPESPQIALDAPAATSEARITSPGVAEGESDSPVRIDSKPAESDFMAEPDVLPEKPVIVDKEVVLTDADLRLLTVWAEDGSLWLLPGYTYKTSEQVAFGRTVSIIAVSADLINLN